MADISNGVAVLVGDPVNGVTVYGPYRTIDEAISIWEDESDVYWWVAPMHVYGDVIDVTNCDRPWCVHCKDESND